MSFRAELVSYVCDATQYLKAITTLMIFFGILAGFSLVLGEPGSGPYALAVVNLAVAVLFIVVLAVIYWRCQQRPEAY